MSKRGKGYPLAAMLLIPGVLTLASPAPIGLGELLKQARSEDYAGPGTDEIRQAEAAFRHWLAAADRDSAAEGSSNAGLDIPGLAPVRLAAPDLVVWTESPQARRGRGLFAVRPAGGAALMIQAPHQYFDRRTGTLARQLFLESNAMTGAWNTAHRYKGQDSDLVHMADSYLHAFSRAFADRPGAGRILQLHGFDSDRRRTSAGRRAQAILSDGSQHPPETLARLTACLSERLGIRALLYPRDVRELGATTNTLAADLRRRGFDGFVHLELDADLRKHLVGDADARKRLVQCVLETAR